jgi:hypothetical protein
MKKWTYCHRYNITMYRHDCLRGVVAVFERGSHNEKRAIHYGKVCRLLLRWYRIKNIISK